jgi:hypothetical protein
MSQGYLMTAACKKAFVLRWAVETPYSRITALCVEVIIVLIVLGKNNAYYFPTSIDCVPIHSMTPMVSICITIFVPLVRTSKQSTSYLTPILEPTVVSRMGKQCVYGIRSISYGTHLTGVLFGCIFLEKRNEFYTPTASSIQKLQCWHLTWNIISSLFWIIMQYETRNRKQTQFLWRGVRKKIK